jgi:tetratricopeptide (TPR) repeat protein
VVLTGAVRARRFLSIQRAEGLRKAEKYYRAAIALSPSTDIYYWSLGDVYRGTNRLEDARRYYKLALQLDPKDLTAPIKLGHVNSFLGHFDEGAPGLRPRHRRRWSGQRGIPGALQVPHLGVLG